MKQFRLMLLYTAFLFASILQSCQKNKYEKPATCSDGIQNQGETSMDCGGPCSSCVSLERQKAVADYNNNYLASEVSNLGWTGSIANCNAGSLPLTTHTKVLQRINYFRRMVGLNDNITWDESKFPMYQEAALMMKANSNLSHDPPSSWKCWTKLGYDGAATSNLALGVHSTRAVTSFMDDGGDINVGHRRWILFSLATKFSYGCTDESMALGVIGMALGNTQIPPFIAYPPKGFTSQTLAFSKWSFSIPGADFTNASVSMTGATGTIGLSVISKKEGFGNSTIVWEPAGIVRDSSSDVSYTVTVSGISKAPQSSYTYTTTLFKP